jgi:GMP synthase-like glutamine amidotransferase
MKYSGPERRRPVLIIQHAQHEHPAALRRALETQGIQTLWMHPYRGEAYPDLSQIRGLISLGGPMGANDDDAHPWIASECELIRKSVEAGLPTVGVCLGGQMMARSLGAEVARNAVAEVGWYPIQVNSHGKKDRILGVAGPEPLVYQWHYDTFQLPPGAILLAASAACPRQAYRIGEHAYGFQFHPEADHQLVQEWLDLIGVDEELESERAKHGVGAVQDSGTQRSRALQGEKSSIKITTAIGQLFQVRKYEPISRDLYERLEALMTNRTLVVLEFEGSDRKTVQLKGTVAALTAIPDGEFVMFRAENTVLWPIRLDYVGSIKLA